MNFDNCRQPDEAALSSDRASPNPLNQQGCLVYFEEQTRPLVALNLAGLPLDPQRPLLVLLFQEDGVARVPLLRGGLGAVEQAAEVGRREREGCGCGGGGGCCLVEEGAVGMDGGSYWGEGMLGCLERVVEVDFVPAEEGVWVEEGRVAVLEVVVYFGLEFAAECVSFGHRGEGFDYFVFYDVEHAVAHGFGHFLEPGLAVAV